MNRRRFFKWLGASAVAAIIAPKEWLFKPRFGDGITNWRNYTTVYPASTPAELEKLKRAMNIERAKILERQLWEPPVKDEAFGIPYWIAKKT